MATTIIMPKLGLTMTEGTIEKWLKKEGDRVEKGEPLLKILTEKINFQYESPASGILRKVLYKEGAVVPVTTPIAIIAEEGEALPEIEVTKTQAPSPEQAPAPAAARKESKEPHERIFASPAAKKIAEEKGIDLSTIAGSGPEGRIVLADVVNAAGKATVAETKLKAAGKVIPLTGIRKIIAQRMTVVCENCFVSGVVVINIFSRQIMPE